MRRSLIPVILCLLAACRHEPPAAPARAPVLALITGSSGPTAAWGTAIRRGAELAVDEARARGQRIELVVEDDGGRPEQAANIAAELIARPDVVAIIGADTSSGTLAIAPLAEKNHIAVVSPTASAPGVTQGRRYVFRVCATDDLEALAAADLARTQLGAKRVVVLRDTKNDYSTGFAAGFAEEFAKRGGVVAQTFDYAAGDSDFRAQLTSARALSPDAILIPGYYGDAAQIASQARDLGITTPLLGGSGWDSPKLTEIGGKAIEGGTFVSGTRKFSLRFVDAFQERYKAEPDAASAQAYDAASILAAVVAQTGPNRQRVRDAFAATRDFPGASGRITIGPNGNARKALGVFRVTDGKFVQTGMAGE
jgi:branched-chain amino acid transport system substrate-binding protein